MQPQKLTPEQRAIRQWRIQRNHLVCRLLDADPGLTRAKALKEANRRMGPMPGRRVNP